MTCPNCGSTTTEFRCKVICPNCKIMLEDCGDGNRVERWEYDGEESHEAKS